MGLSAASGWPDAAHEAPNGMNAVGEHGDIQSGDCDGEAISLLTPFESDSTRPVPRVPSPAEAAQRRGAALRHGARSARLRTDRAAQFKIVGSRSTLTRKVNRIAAAHGLTVADNGRERTDPRYRSPLAWLVVCDAVAGRLMAAIETAGPDARVIAELRRWIGLGMQMRAALGLLPTRQDADDAPWPFPLEREEPHR